MKRNAYCSTCGTAYDNTSTYPRTCPGCKTTIWANPIPVSVAIVPVIHQARTGVLVVRRGIEPKRGLLALVGGFLEEHETWQQGAARETREETGVGIDAATLVPFWFTSTEPKPNRVLLFSLAEPLKSDALGGFSRSSETTERGLVFGPDRLEDVFAFPLHIEAVRRYFNSKNVRGGHGYL
jgi:ADP-ribose pyrophosphatase YjhB (NUDIX family)